MRKYLVFIALIFLFSCKNSIGPGLAEVNLIKNGNFEYKTISSIVPDTSGWINIGLDSNSTNDSGYLVEDSINGTLNWCLKTIPIWFGNDDPYYPQTFITNQSGNNVYQLSANANGKGFLGLYQLRNGQYIHQKKLSIDSNIWLQYSFLDTLNIQPQDSIAVVLSAGMTEIATWNIYFDNVSLFKK